MRLTLKKVTIDNIMSIGHIELQLDGRGVTLIEGRNLTDPSLTSNGTAKSSILGSIFYAIYGRFPAKDGVKSDDIINRKVGKKAKVVLEFEKNGKDYKIERSRKPNHVYFFCGEDDLTTNSASNTDKLIKNTIGISEQLFLNAVLFDSINSKRFAIMNDKERKEMFTEVLSLDLYSKALELAKEDLKALEGEIDRIKMTDLPAVEHRIGFYNQQQQQQQESRQALVEKVEGAKAVVDTRKQELATLLSSGVQDRIAQLEKELQDSMYTPHIQNSQAEYQAYSQKEKEVSILNEQLARVKSDVQNLLNKKEQYEQSNLCPECGSEMDKEHRDSEVAKILEKCSEYLPKAQELQRQIAEHQEQLPALWQAYTDAQKVQEEAQREVNNKAQKVQRINTELSMERSKQSQAEYNIQLAENTYNTLKEQLKTPITDYDTLLQDEQASLEDMRSTLLAKVDEQAHLKNAVLAYSDKGVKSHLIDQAVPFLNEKINHYLGTLTGSTITAIISTQKELTTGDKSDKIDLVVDNKAGAGSYGALSAGEKRRVDIAISLALQDLVMGKSDLQINTLYYDEVFENLDEVGCENTIELLKDRTDLASSIYVITHNEKLKSLFNNVITVIKEDGFSRVEESNN